MNELLITDKKRRIAVYRVSVEAIRPLRHRLLRPGLPPESAHFTGDHRLNTWHIGAFRPAELGDEGLLICCASFMAEPYKDENAWQLRGMCTDPEHQGCGIGATLLGAAIKAILADSGVKLFWCNARVPAAGFYEKQGWRADSKEFDIPTAGPHQKMFKWA